METACCTIQYSRRQLHYKDFRVFGIDLRTVQRIRKELDESNDDDKGTAARKPHSGKKKRIPEFLAEIQAIIDDDSSLVHSHKYESA